MKDELIKALKTATIVQELIQASSIANARLQQLEIFDSVNITLDSEPPKLPDTTNVIVEVVETKNPFIGDLGIYSKPEVKTGMTMTEKILARASKKPQLSPGKNRPRLST